MPKECLAFSVVFPAKSTYSNAADIKTFIINGNKLEPDYISSTNGSFFVVYGYNEELKANNFSMRKRVMAN